MPIVKGVCTQKGIVFQTADLRKSIKPLGILDLKKQLTIRKTKRMGHRYSTREEKLYMEFDSPVGIIIVSRFALGELRSVFKKHAQNWSWRLENKIPAGDSILPERLIPGPVLDSNQQIISDYLDQNVFTAGKIKSTRSSTVLVMKTGLGKTYVGAAKIREIGKKTLIIVPSKSVMGEWQKALASCYPEMLVGNYLQKTDGDVVIMVVNTAAKDTIAVKTKNPATGRTVLKKYKYFEYFKKFGFVIYDEIHNYTSRVKQKALWRTNMACCLGLTATPSADAWGMDIIFQKHVGPLLQAEDIPEFNPDQVQWQGSYKPIMYQGPSEFTQTIRTPATGWTSHPKMINQFASDPYRTIVLLDLLKQLYNRNRNVFVFFKTRGFADIIQELLIKFVLPDVSVSDTPQSTILMGGATDADKSNAMSSSIVLTTYGYGWQGVSIPKMDTLVFATPRMAKMEQIIGRILRKSGNTSIKREIWDLVDAGTELGKKEYATRQNAIAKIVKFDKIAPVKLHWSSGPNWADAEIIQFIKHRVAEPEDPEDLDIL